MLQLVPCTVKLHGIVACNTAEIDLNSHNELYSIGIAKTSGNDSW